MWGPKVSAFLIVLTGLAVLSPGMSAEETKLSEREAMYTRYLEFPSLVKGGSVQPHWMANGSTFWYEEAAGRMAKTPSFRYEEVAGSGAFYKIDPEANTRVALLDTARLRAALQALEPERAWPAEMLGEHLSLLSDDTVVKLTVDGSDYLVRLDTYTASKAPRAPLNPDAVPRQYQGQPGAASGREERSPDGRWLAGIGDHNLYLRSTEDGRTRQLTADGEQWYEWTLRDRDSDPANRWSPDRSKLAVKKKDYRQVPAARRPVFPGTLYAEMRTELFIIDVPSQKRVQVESARERGEEIRVLGWRRDGSELLYLVRASDGKRLDLRAANATSGATRVILSERQETAVTSLWLGEPFPLFTTLEDGERFIWRSERDGWNHLYLYRLDGTLVRRLTTGRFPVHQIEAVDEREGWVYFIASGDQRRPYDLHLYRVTLEGRRFQQLTKQPGQHAVAFSPSKKYYLDTHSAPDRPPLVELHRANGQLKQVLSMANVTALAQLQWRPPDPLVVKAADGRTDLHGVLYKPYDFDPRKRYPVIEHIYAGPHLSLMGTMGRLGSFLGWWGAVEAQALAQLGFVVFIVDGRGTPDRGKAFQDVGHRDPSLPDHVAALRGLARERPYMDLGRVGIFGHSYGGYMVLRALLTEPEVYHVGFASDADTESLLPLARNLKGKLLLSHSDEGHYAGEAARLVKAFTEAGKRLDLLPPLAGQDHFLRGSYGTRVRAARSRYFQEHLKP